MIEKVLDRYYCRKLFKKLEDDLSLYYIDKKIIYEKDYAEMCIKKREWKDDFYINIMKIYYSRAFEMFIFQYNDILKECKDQIEVRCK